MEMTLEPLYVTQELILSKISEEEVFEHYGIAVKKGLFCSHLRQDKRPTVSFFRSKTGKLYLKDFGDGSCHDCFSYVQALFGVSYYMALQIIANDFGIISRPKLEKNKPKIQYSGVKFEDKESAIIQVQTRDFNEKELNWWRQYGVKGDTLKKFKVFPVDSVWLNDHLFYQNIDNKYVFGYYGGTKDGIEFWRLYWPGRTKFKFISNWKSHMLQGAHMLPEKGDYIVITKAMKDVIVLYEYGIPAIAPCSETLFITENQYNKLKARFKHIYCLYDNDRAGLINMAKFRRMFPDITYLKLDPNDAKDISDYRKSFGHQKTLDLINKCKEYYGEK